MTTRAMERRALGAIAQYEASRMLDLSDAYGRWSDAKAAAWRYCEARCEAYNGENRCETLKVISKNTNIFTAGFTFTDEDGNEKFYYITPTYDVIVDYK